MPFPLLTLIPGLLRTVAKFAGLDSGGILSKAAETLENISIPPEKQAEMEQALQKHEEAMAALSIEEMKTAQAESIAMVQSEDKYVSRARPTGLYIFYGVSAAIAIAMLFGVKIDSTAILTILGPLAGVGGTYVYQRTQEKKAQLAS